MTLPNATVHAVATRKAMIRLLPVLAVAYFMSYIDRTNVALAKTQLEADVGISAAAYGLGAGIFFLSYALLEVPSNLVLYRVGARVWITRIAVTWGLISAAMMFTTGPVSFYILRFLLGAAEAGLYPALMYMVTLWFADRHRVTAVGMIYLAPALAIVVGGPAGGGLMTLDGLAGLHGWQWMFMVEGLVTVAVGIGVWFLLPSTPRDASWLTPEEADALTREATAEAPPSPDRLKGNMRLAFGHPVVITLALIYLLNQFVNSAVAFNLPSIVEKLGISSSFTIGLVTGSMGVSALLGVLLFPFWNRRYGRTVGMILVCAAAATVLFGGYLLVDDGLTQMAMLWLANFFVIGTLPLFWAVAMSRMSGLMAAAGLAFINMIGLSGGFFGPLLFGLIEDATGSSRAPFALIIGAGVLGVVLAATLGRLLGRDPQSAREPANAG